MSAPLFCARASRRRPNAGHSTRSRRSRALRDRGPGGGTRISGSSSPPPVPGAAEGESSLFGIVVPPRDPSAPAAPRSGAHPVSPAVLRVVEALVGAPDEVVRGAIALLEQRNADADRHADAVGLEDEQVLRDLLPQRLAE